MTRRPVVLLATDSRDRGAGSRLIEALVAGLPEYGLEAAVSVGGEGHLWSALSNGGVTPYRVPLRVVPRKVWPFPFAWAVWRLMRVIRESGARVVHVNEHESYPVVARAAHLAGVSVICHVRFAIEPAYARWLFGPTYVPARLVFNSRTLQRVCEPSLRNVVAADRWRVVRNGIDFGRFGKGGGSRERLRREFGIADSTIVLGSACAISPRKRVDHFVRLVAALRGEGFDVVGVHAGRAHFPEDVAVEQELRELAVCLGIADSMRFLGYVEPVEPLYYAWDVLVSTSVRESFGMTVLEAMACGCPVVGYPAESLPEVVGDAGVLVADGDTEALLAAVRLLVRDPAGRLELGCRGAERARRHFDVRRSVALLASEYQAVMAGDHA